MSPLTRLVLASAQAAGAALIALATGPGGGLLAAIALAAPAFAARRLP
jgi:hypothetical protein